MMNLLKQNSIRLLSGLLTAAAVASCQIPESERIPSVFEIQPSSISTLALDAGALDPETTLPDFLSALDAAGMQTYLDAANAQLEAYMAAK